MKQHLFLALLVVCLSVAVFAQDDANLLTGRDADLFKQTSASETCRLYASYVVKTAPDPNGGETVKVFGILPGAFREEGCKTKTDPLVSLSGTYSGKNKGINEDITSNFVGLAGKFLFIEKLVEPFVGAIEIFDLKTGKSVFKDEIYENIRLSQKRFLDYEKWSKKDGSLKNCPQAAKWKKSGLGVGWVQKHRLDLQTFKLTNGALRCEAQQ